VDTSVALVQTYLRVNGYFIVAQFPVVERRSGQRSAGDLQHADRRLGRLHLQPRHDRPQGRRHQGTKNTIAANRDDDMVPVHPAVFPGDT